jgi:hypothetical protein
MNIQFDLKMNLFSPSVRLITNMALGEKLFEESGQLTSTKVTRVHPVEGTTMEVSFTSDLEGIGKFPSGKNIGSGVMTQYPHGSTDASYQGFVTAEGNQFMWWAHEKGKMSQDGKVRGIIMVSGYSTSQKLSWLNQLLILIETELDPSSGQFRNVGYEWR